MLATRVLAALVFAPALLGLIWVGGLWLSITCFALSLLMLWEFVRLVLPDASFRLKGAAYSLTALVAAAVLGWLPAAFITVLPPLVLLGVLCSVLFQPDPMPTSMTRAGLVLLGVFYCGALFPLLSALRGGAHGLGLSLMALFCTWGADTGAYFAGRAFGRHKLYPKVSPAKTLEGGVGGLVLAVAMAFFIREMWHVPMIWQHAATLGVLGGLFGTLGDLSESLLKRSVGAKDSSHIIPGHGGVLDRFDGVMFAVPAFYIYIALFQP